MSREITEHQVSSADRQLQVLVTDEPGGGGANHRYQITGFSTRKNPSREVGDPMEMLSILFHNGPIPEHGLNGITVEALLAVCADRLRSFQAGPFPSRANEKALQHIEESMHWLQQRTIDRMRRGVEGQEKA